MPKKNSVASLLKNTKTQSVLKQANPSSVARIKNNKPGAQKKSLEDKESKAVGLRFTESEYAKIKEKAGMVPLATFIKETIRTKTNIMG